MKWSQNRSSNKLTTDSKKNGNCIYYTATCIVCYLMVDLFVIESQSIDLMMRLIQTPLHTL